MTEDAFRGTVIFLLLFFGIWTMGSLSTANSRLSSIAYDVREIERLVREVR